MMSSLELPVRFNVGFDGNTARPHFRRGTSYD